MKSRLKNAGLFFSSDADPEIDISVAWSVLSHLSYPARYGGKTLSGLYEYVVIDPKSGNLLSTGQGATIERAMCEAALNAWSLLDSG
jgi:hypothetical protein